MNANPFAELFETFFNTSDLTGSADMSVVAFLAIFFGVLLAILGVTLVLCLVLYVVNSLGLYRLAKKLGVSYAFLAWIPYASYFIMGKIVEKCDERRGIPVRRWSLIVLLTMIGAATVAVVVSSLTSMLSIIPLIGFLISMLGSLLSMLLSAATLALDCICRWKIYREFYSETFKIVWTIVGAVCNIQPIITLITSFRTPNPAQDACFETDSY